MPLCKEIAYGAERDKSIVPSFICFVLIIGALVAAISMYGREHYLFSLGSLMVGVGASVSLLLNSHARKRGCIATWGKPYKSSHLMCVRVSVLIPIQTLYGSFSIV